MERTKRRKCRPSIEAMEGRMLLSTSTAKISQPRGVDATSPLAQTSTNTAFDYTTPQGAKVTIQLNGPGSLAGTSLDSAGDLNLVFSGTTVFTSIIGNVKGGPGTANLESITSESLGLGSLSGIGGDLIGRVLLPKFNLISGGEVNLTAGVQSFSLNSVAGGAQVHLRDTPLNTSLGLQSYENTVTGTGVTYAQLSSSSTGATSSSATGLSSGTSVGVATGQSAGGVTTLGTGTLNPTAVGFGGGEVGAVNGAIPIINTVGNGENYLGTPGLTQTEVSQGRTINYVTGNDGGTQLSTIAGTFAPGANLIEPSDISLPPDRVPPPGILININHVNGSSTANSPPLGDPLVYGYDAKAGQLIEFDASTGTPTGLSITLPTSSTGSGPVPVGGVSLATYDSELVVLVAMNPSGAAPYVLAYNAAAPNSSPVYTFTVSSDQYNAGFTTITGIATAGNTTVLEDSAVSQVGPTGTGTIQEIDLTQSLAMGKEVTVGNPFTPNRQFFLAGTLTGVPGTGNFFALGSAYFDTSQPAIKQAGILTLTPSAAGLTESTRTVLTNSTTGIDQPADPTTNGLPTDSNALPSIAIGSRDSYLAIDYGAIGTSNLINFFSPNGLTSEGSVSLQASDPLADLSQSFHPELANTALIDVQGNVQSYTGQTATGMVLNVAGNFDQLTIKQASNSNVIGLPFAHVNIASRSNVSILTNSRLVGVRNGVTVNSSQKEVGPLFLS